MLATASDGEARLAARAEGDAIEPVAEQVGVADRLRFLSQDQEDSLHGVFGVVAIAQQLVAHAQDQPAVAEYQPGERRLADRVMPRDEAVQELAVR